MRRAATAAGWARVSTRRALGAAVGVALCCLGPASAPAQSLPDRNDVAAFVDGAAPALLRADQAPGLTVSVVKDGEIVFAKGYGIARAESRTPVVADRTLFRVGSVSKIFLATALMQLVEQGKIDLDTDLNEYLEGVEIPATFEDPITLRHVMTHTTGFEDSIRDLFVPLEDDRPLKEVLAGHLPARVRPPGELIAYSNHATALAGLVVEQVSGEPYEAYLDRHVFEPLGMHHSSARQPLPEGLAARTSTGPRPDDFFIRVAIAPAGSVSSTATDMARFMIAHLQHGRLGDARILEEETARRMQTRLLTLDPRVNGLAHQFFENDIGGVRMIGHSGGMVTHLTSMVLLPEHGAGFFASVNGRSAAPFLLTRLLTERYFPATRPRDPTPMDGAGERLPRFVGWYRESRSGVHSSFALADFMNTKQATLSTNGQGPRLRMMDKDWVETEPLLFREVGGPDWLLFQEDERGEVRAALRGLSGHSVLLREPWWRGIGFQRLLAAGIGGLLLWPFLHRPAWRARRWWQEARQGGGRGLARWLAAGIRTSGLGFVVCLAVGSTILAQTLGAERHATLYVAATLPYLLGALSFSLLVTLARLWRRGVLDGRARLGLASVVLGGLALTAWAGAWNVVLPRL